MDRGEYLKRLLTSRQRRGETPWGVGVRRMTSDANALDPQPGRPLPRTPGTAGRAMPGHDCGDALPGQGNAAAGQSNVGLYPDPCPRAAPPQDAGGRA